MRSRLQTQVTISLTLMRVTASEQCFAEFACPHCSVELGWDQPDLDNPDRLLGICPKCRMWFMMDLLPAANQAVILLLPERDAVRQSVRA